MRLLIKVLNGTFSLNCFIEVGLVVDKLLIRNGKTDGDLVDRYFLMCNRSIDFHFLCFCICLQLIKFCKVINLAIGMIAMELLVSKIYFSFLVLNPIFKVIHCVFVHGFIVLSYHVSTLFKDI